MCKLGDIIVVKSYTGDDGKKIKQHSFIVVDDEAGTISGLDYTMVASVISSFKDEEQKKRKLKYDGNMELPIDSLNEFNFKKESYVKADKAFYFDKEKLDYYVFATIKEEWLDKLLHLILKLAKEGKLEQITNNL